MAENQATTTSKPPHNRGKKRIWVKHDACMGTGATPWSNFTGQCDACRGEGGWYRFVAEAITNA